MFKKQRASKRKEVFNSKKFVSADAEERYENAVLHKAFIAERGFSNPGGRVEAQIAQRHWDYFTASPSSACAALVREFYANAIAQKSSTIFVRGRWVGFDSSSINRLYQLEDFEDDQYMGFRNSPIDYDEILKYLCGGEEKVSWKRSGNHVTNFPSSGLDSESKAWHYFISSRLLPSGNTSEVTRERAVLNYCIQSGLTIDVGKIIFQSLRHIFQANTPVALGHPSVIHDLCMAYGVEFLAAEEMMPPKTSISKGKISAYSARSTAEAGESSAPARSPPSRGRALSLTDRVGRLEEEVHDLRLDVRETTRVLNRREEREDRREKRDDHRARQEAMYRQYMVDYHQADYASRHPSAGFSFPYPEAPSFSEYREEAEEEGEDEEGEGDDYDD